MWFLKYFNSSNVMLFGYESSQTWWAREHNWLRWERQHEADTWSHHNLAHHIHIWNFVCFVCFSSEHYYQFVHFLFRAWLRPTAGPMVQVPACYSQLGASSAHKESRAANPRKLVMSLVKLLVGSDSHPKINVSQGWAWGMIIRLKM